MRRSRTSPAIAGPATRAADPREPDEPVPRVVDIEAVARAPMRAGSSSSWTTPSPTPVLQRPLTLGADLVMHSLTKSLSGHSDLIGGALAGPRERIASARDTMKILGGLHGPARGLPRPSRAADAPPPRQAAVRERRCAGAHLDGRPKIARVLYPGLVRPSRTRGCEAADDGLRRDAVHRPRRRPSRGRALLRRASPHGARGEPRRRRDAGEPPGAHVAPRPHARGAGERRGVDPGTVRISLGVEDAADLVADADEALARV